MPGITNAVPEATVKFSPLPYPSDGVEVEDENFPWPEKKADAVDGFFDNRGDFHPY